MTNLTAQRRTRQSLRRSTYRLAAILTALDVILNEFFRPFKDVSRG